MATSSDATLQRQADRTDLLSACDREPIHIPGSIQPHGILFLLADKDLRIAAVSANVATFLGREPSAALGRALGEIVAGVPLEAATLADAPIAEGTTRAIAIQPAGRAGEPWPAVVVKTQDGLILEAFPHQAANGPAGNDLFDHFDEATRRLQAAANDREVCQVLAGEVARLTGYDRVMVYRFAHDWSGEVTAEAGSGALPSYLGLHFPASDIPAQARALYAINPFREIPDIGYEPIPLVQQDPARLDLTHAALRSVSPVHIEYLRNMGVGASMSISILRDGELWGLVACHHATPRRIPGKPTRASVLLARLAAWKIKALAEAEVARCGINVQFIAMALLREVSAGRNYRDALLAQSDELLSLLPATGLLVRSGGVSTTIGNVPPDDDVIDLLGWLTNGRAKAVFMTDRLSDVYPPAGNLPEAAGLLAVPLGGDPEDLILWFRHEVLQDVTWAGDPAKPVDPQGVPGRLTPRASFTAWTSSVAGRSRPWEEHEVAAASGLRDVIVDIILRRLFELDQMNADLARNNEELESFSYVAAHDLREPLRQIETFGSLLSRVLSNQTPAATTAARWLEGIQASSKRVRALIEDLAEYARLGRNGNPLRPVDLNEILADVKGDLQLAIDDAGASVYEDDLPVVMGDRTQMRQVFQNVIANALKYRSRGRRCMLAITTAVRREPAIGPRAEQAFHDIAISDNGIGFEMRHCERIFEPFQRLHSTDEYEGSGIGLAICRKIMARHSGTITATSQPGVGSVFTISLPARPMSAENGASA